MVSSGLILLHKRPGITSFDSLRDIKRMLGSGKAGHTGTLDKFAEGLLLVLTSRALKLSKWFTNCDKQYEGTVCFGVETDTLDPEGVSVATAPMPSREAVESALSLFCGKIEQAPPAYSAIHIDGERASVLARRGEAPEMKKRPVNIYRLELLSWEPPHARIFVHCSSGTYIRSLARDLALAAGSCGFLKALIRTNIGGFSLEEGFKGDRGPGTGDRGALLESETGCQHAQRANNNSPVPGPRSPVPFLHPINKAVFEKLNIPCIEIPFETVKNVMNGKPLEQILRNIPAFSAESGNTAALFSGDNLIAVIERAKNENFGNLPNTDHYPLTTNHYPWNYGYVYASN